MERLSLRYVRDCLSSWPGSEVADSVVWVLEEKETERERVREERKRRISLTMGT